MTRPVATPRRGLEGLRRIRSLVGALALAACSTAGGGEATRSTGDITRAELDGGSFLSAYAAIERLRPTWIRARAAPSFGASPSFPTVYVDGIVRGDVGELRSIPVADVQTLRYLSPSDATTRFGTGHTAGAILVTTNQR